MSHMAEGDSEGYSQTRDIGSMELRRYEGIVKLHT